VCETGRIHSEEMICEVQTRTKLQVQINVTHEDKSLLTLKNDYQSLTDDKVKSNKRENFKSKKKGAGSCIVHFNI
jgi:hypothetical protein